MKQGSETNEFQQIAFYWSFKVIIKLKINALYIITAVVVVIYILFLDRSIMNSIIVISANNLNKPKPILKSESVAEASLYTERKMTSSRLLFYPMQIQKL